MERQNEYLECFEQMTKSRCIIFKDRLKKEHPTVPIWTIHDSIATIEEYLPLVEEVMREECMKLIGSVPKLKREKW
jgi:hypothetical protein